MLTWVTKKGVNTNIIILIIACIIINPSPKAYGFIKVTASKFINLKD